MALRSALLVLGGAVVASAIDGALEAAFVKGGSVNTGIFSTSPLGVHWDDVIPAYGGLILLLLALFMPSFPMKGTLTLFFAGWTAYYLGTAVGAMVAGLPSLGTGNAFFGKR